MKKSLVALAALSATAAMSQVTISGLIDFAGANVGGTQAVAKGSTISTTVGTSATSVIRIIAVEDLGGGLKITGQYNLDPRTLANDSYSVTNNRSTVAAPGSTGTLNVATTANIGRAGAQSNTAVGLARDEVFVGISGGFGNLRLGAPNSIGLNSFQVGSPLGTGIGSGYTGGSTSSTMTNAYTVTRHNRSVRFDSPNMNGFTVSALYAPGNDQAATTVASTTAAPDLPAAQLIPNSRRFTEIGLRYDNGPLSVAYANIASKNQNVAGGFYAIGSNTTGQATSTNTVNASYSLGATTLYAGMVNGDLIAPTSTALVPFTSTVKATRLGVKHTIGAVDLAAMSTTQKDSTAAGVETKRTLTGVRLDYNFSKTSAAYFGYEKWDTGAAYDTAKDHTLTGTRTITSMGLRKSF
jgi:predicted porin